MWVGVILLAGLHHATGSVTRHDGVTINLLGEELFFCTNPYKARIAAFENLTGAKINYIPMGNDKNYLTELKIEIGSEVEEGIGLYDVYALKGSWVPDLAAGGGIEDLKPFIKERPLEMAWDDIFPSVRDYIMTLDGKVITFPSDADYVALAYRQDLLAPLGLSPPRSWDEVLSLGQEFHGHDLNNDTLPDYGVCLMALGDITQSYGQVMAVVAPYMQSKGTSQGVFFDPNTMEPLVTSDGFQKGLLTYKELTKISVMDQWSFGKGKCAFFVTLPGFFKISSVPPEKYGPKQFSFEARMSPPPGTTEVLDWETGKVKPCSKQLCPHLSADGVNRVPFWAESGFFFSMSSHSRPVVKKAAADFLFYMQTVSLADVVEDQGCFDPWRRSHVAADTLPKYEASWHNQTEMIKSYKRAAEESLESANTGLDIRIPGFLEYVQAFTDEVEKFLADQLTLEESTQNIYNQWQTTTRKYGISRQRKAYRKSIGLPPLACEKGMFLNNANGNCEPCPDGSFGPVAGLEACEPCMPGSYTNSTGQLVCALCPAGFAQPKSGQTGCVPCHPGFASGERGTPSCEACRRGYVAPLLGQLACETCEKNTYQDQANASTCHACPAGRVTLLLGAPSKEDCTCATGTYSTRAEANLLGAAKPVGSEFQCLPCQQGMQCSGEHSLPKLRGGYYSEAQEPFKIYLCRAKDSCPGGLPGNCTGGQVGSLSEVPVDR